MDDKNEEPQEEPQPQILGEISREKRGEMFEKWMRSEDRVKYHHFGFQQQWLDTNRLLGVEYYIDKGNWELIHRNYYFLTKSGSFAQDALFTYLEENKAVQITVGFGGDDERDEGTQRFDYYPGLNMCLEKDIKGKKKLTVVYDIDGKLTFVTFSGDQQLVQIDLVGIRDRLASKKHVMHSENHKMEIINDYEESFVQCRRFDDEGATLEVFKIPRQVVIEDCLEKIVPTPLRENPLAAPSRFDNWRHVDFMKAFGVLEEPPDEKIRKIEFDPDPSE